MVKEARTTPEELLREDERLERLFRQTITRRKHLEVNQSQFQSRVLDLFDAIFRAGASSKAHLPLLLRRAPNVLNKFCISAQGAKVNGERILQNLHQVVVAQAAELPGHLEAVDALVKTIFNIFVYKKPKDYVQVLVRIVLALLKTRHPKLVKTVEQNLGVLVSFLDKGRDVEKVFFTFRKILGHSHQCLWARFPELLGILEHTPNHFLVEQVLKFLFEVFHSSLLTASDPNDSSEPSGRPQQDRVPLARFAGVFETHCMQVYLGIVAREKRAEPAELKKTQKSRLYLEKLIEYLKGHTEGSPIGNMSKALGLLKTERKAREGQTQTQSQSQG